MLTPSNIATVCSLLSIATVFGRPSQSSHKLLKHNNTLQVHNVILYPERHAWCEGKQIQQIIGHEDCEPQVIENTVCVGQCFTYSVPRTIPVNPEDKMLHYCDSCRPSRISWKQVTLRCNNKEVPELTILVEHVEDCACQSCISNEYGLDIYNASFPSDVDVADILYRADRFEWSKLQYARNEHISSELIPRQTIDEDDDIEHYSDEDDDESNNGVDEHDVSASNHNVTDDVSVDNEPGNQTAVPPTTPRARRRHYPLH